LPPAVADTPSFSCENATPFCLNPDSQDSPIYPILFNPSKWRNIMITQYHKIALTVAFGLAMAFTFSACSSEEPPPGGELNNNQNSGNNTLVNCQFDGLGCYDKSWEDPYTYDECLSDGGTIVSSCPSAPPPPPSNPTCGSVEYNPATEQCCGSNKFTTSTQFCSGNTVYDKCGSSVVYDPSTEQCCGSNKFTTSTQFCSSNAVYPKCSGSEYNTSTHFCDTRKDSRNDNKLYKYIKVYIQTWMAENLAYNPTTGGSVCSDNATTCATYGRLYTWAAAKSACPAGWHLPSDYEWNALIVNVGGGGGLGLTAGTKLKAKNGWYTGSGYIAGTDTDGFSALPGGFADLSDNSHKRIGERGFWWSADEYDTDKALIWGIYYDSEAVDWVKGNKSNQLVSVRCVKD
jgi:uncharacterized protein (TIGR02145 family)